MGVYFQFDASKLSKQYMAYPLALLMFLTEKHDGRTKEQTRADNREK